MQSLNQFHQEENFIKHTIKYLQAIFADSSTLSSINAEHLVDFSSLLQKVDLITTQLKIPEVGLLLGKQRKLDDMGLLAFGMRSCKNLQQALEYSLHFPKMAELYAKIQLSFDGEYAYIEVTNQAPIVLVNDISIDDCLVHYYYGILNLIDVNPTHIQVLLTSQDPAKISQYRQYLDTHPIINSSKNALRFPQQWLSKKITSNINIQTEQLDDTEDGSLIAEIRLELLRHLGGELPSLEKIAAKYNVSSRTLRRMLADESTNYKKLVLDFRIAVAKLYLEQSKLDVLSISILLGYQSPAPFFRAFKRETQQSPSSYRSSIH
ncbi:AraC family transcriptional regulator [Paraferrimonas sp. SM1919]|uniref:AraC family transcriptional regulator n=1 Tax=Paraferrimonas sp. SM1919 TaxID=2662263 RepID=UPI0013D16274|nr:AraC family transcriptional regulator [Paraferrimonas sp. SM1919]